MLQKIRSWRRESIMAEPILAGTLPAAQHCTPVSPLHKWCVAAIFVLFSILTSVGANTLLPQTDEAVYANPGYNLTYNGHTGTTLYELRGYMPESMSRHTYWQFPLYFFVTAAWYKVFGFGLFQVRLLSILFGLVSITSWYWIVRRLSGSPTAGLFAMAFTALDFFFVLGAATGRMDMLCCGLGSAALATYVILRERSTAQAIFWSHLLATFCIMTHGAGVLYWVALVWLILPLVRRPLSWKLFAAAVVPALFGMLLWGLFILKDPAGFREQMQRSIELLSGYWDTTGLSRYSWLRSLQLEWIYRYQGPFGLGPGVGIAQRLKALVLLAYVAPILGVLFSKRVRHSPGLAPLAVMTLIAAGYLGLASPSKFYYYLPHVTVFMAASFGAFLCWLLDLKSRRQRLIYAAAIVVAAVQLGGILYRVRQDPYHRSYLPMVEIVRKHSTPHSIIMAPGEVWFTVEHDRYMIYDPSLGYRSSMVPSIIVWSKTERELQAKHKLSAPLLYQHVQRLLDTGRLIFEDENYQVYRR